jgi:hypothetical protein
MKDGRLKIFLAQRRREHREEKLRKSYDKIILMTKSFKKEV